MTILLGLSDDAEAVVRRAVDLGLKAASARWISAGVIPSDAVDEWVGLEPVDGLINLRAPRTEPGDEPNTWMRFEPFWANTSDLVALSA